jgi:hypothetical protein
MNIDPIFSLVMFSTIPHCLLADFLSQYVTEDELTLLVTCGESFRKIPFSKEKQLACEITLLSMCVCVCVCVPPPPRPLAIFGKINPLP